MRQAKDSKGERTSFSEEKPARNASAKQKDFPIQATGV
jgi:hypothetical protein